MMVHIIEVALSPKSEEFVLKMWRRPSVGCWDDLAKSWSNSSYTVYCRNCKTWPIQRPYVCG